MKPKFGVAVLLLCLSPLPAFAQEACGAGDATHAAQGSAGATCTTETAADTKSFGAPIDDKNQKAQDLKSVVGRASAAKGRDVLIQAEIDKVCQQKGCWAILRQGDTQVRMTFKNYSFFLPKNSKGRKVLALGHLKEKELSVADARHYLQDAGASKEEIEKIKTPQKEYSFVASGVRFLD